MGVMLKNGLGSKNFGMYHPWWVTRDISLLKVHNSYNTKVDLKFVYPRNRLIVTENKLVVSRGEGVGSWAK